MKNRLPVTALKGAIWQISVITILILVTSASQAQPYYIFSYTYQNVTRANGGGTLEPGDVIEVRALMKVDRAASRMYYIDTIPDGLQYIPNSMKIVTNEGLLFAGNYTDASNDDRGVYVASPGPPRLRINIGTGAGNAQSGGGFGSTSGGGSITPGDKPKFYGTTLFVVAYRLTVTAAFGDTIYPTGTFRYRDYNSSNKVQRMNYAGIRVMPNQDLCNNFSSASFTAESSFGQGSIQNRVLGANVPDYIKINLGANSPQDNYYSIANNTSADGTTDNTGPYKPSTNNHRVFGGFWDIVGDHTGAIDPFLGNPAPAAGTNGGYMLVVNAAYPTGEAYNDVIKNVCPNTYYEFSAWVRNICGFCGIDADSKATYTPGVLPNLAFTINDIDYYTTGVMPWIKRWEKRGFIYKTGVAESTFKITVKNNAAGGGGNDWVLDDITLATCYPNLTMNPTDTAKVCAGTLVNLYDTVRSYFNNYTYFCWEKSIDGGLTWVNTGNCSSKTPVLKNGLWEYIVDTSFIPVVTDSGSFYRVKVATTSANLSNPNCSVNNSQKVFMKVYNYDCSVLEGVLKDFSGKLENGYALIKWSTLSETGVKNFELQRSSDGVHFSTIKTIAPAYRQGGLYQERDSQLVSGTNFYRLLINGQDESRTKYSKVISIYQLNTSFSVKVVNPFTSTLNIEVTATVPGIYESCLFDNSGRMILKKTYQVSKGSNQVVIDGIGSLKAGVYILSSGMNGHAVRQKVLKIY